MEVPDQGISDLMLPGDSIFIFRYSPHRFTGILDSKIVEASSYDAPEDSVRECPSGDADISIMQKGMELLEQRRGK